MRGATASARRALFTGVLGSAKPDKVEGPDLVQDEVIGLVGDGDVDLLEANVGPSERLAQQGLHARQLATGRATQVVAREGGIDRERGLLVSLAHVQGDHPPDLAAGPGVGRSLERIRVRACVVVPAQRRPDHGTAGQGHRQVGLALEELRVGRLGLLVSGHEAQRGRAMEERVGVIGVPGQGGIGALKRVQRAAGHEELAAGRCRSASRAQHGRPGERRRGHDRDEADDEGRLVVAEGDRPDHDSDERARADDPDLGRGGVSEGHFHDALEQGVAVKAADGQEVEQAPAESHEEHVVDERLRRRRGRQEPCCEHDHDAQQQARKGAGEREDDAAMDAGVVAGRLAATAVEDDAGCDPEMRETRRRARPRARGRRRSPRPATRAGASRCVAGARAPRPGRGTTPGSRPAPRERGT